MSLGGWLPKGQVVGSHLGPLKRDVCAFTLAYKLKSGAAPQAQSLGTQGSSPYSVRKQSRVGLQHSDTQREHFQFFLKDNCCDDCCSAQAPSL